MRCAAFTEWLDGGRPETVAVAMRAHAGECPRCAAALRAAQELDEALAVRVRVTAPAGFTAGVMRRVREARAAAAPARVLSLPPALAWWVRAAADPWVAVSLLLSATVAWRHEALWAIAADLAARIAAFGEITLRLPGAGSLTIGTPALLRVFADPFVLLGLALALAPAGLWASWRLFRWSEHAVAMAGQRRAR